MQTEEEKLREAWPWEQAIYWITVDLGKDDSAGLSFCGSGGSQKLCVVTSGIHKVN